MLSYPTLPVLIVDDEVEAAEECRLTLRASGITHVVCCHDSREVVPMLSERDFSVLLLDLWMPHINGSELLATLSTSFPHLPVIVVTGANDVETAVECMRIGARDYMVKPVEQSRMVSSVKRAIELREVELEYRSFQEHIFSARLDRPEAFSAIVTQNAGMNVLFRYVETIAPTRKPVLITGETGVGKELFARAVHTLSKRPGPFVAVNVAALDDHTFSDTLFGHQKGAFTDAHAVREGLIKQASDGTLFLDEIGDLSLPSQAKLLRLIQEGEYFPLGMDAPKKTTARLVTATNHELESKVKDGSFRRDLYHRLHAHHVRVPPLRDRLEDIPFLVDRFLEQSAAELEKKKPTVPPELFALLRVYDFPGNVRELENAVFEAVSQHESGVLSLEVFRDWVKASSDGFALGVESGEPDLFRDLRVLPSMRLVREALYREALRRADGNQTIAASLIGVSQSGVSRLAKQWE